MSRTLMAKPHISKPMLWAGRVAGVLIVVFMVFDAVLHLMRPAAVVTAFAQLGFPITLAVRLGVLELVCVAAYVVPRTSALGAVLLTGYLGGAVASQLRVGHSFFETIFPVILGCLVWGALVVRDERARAVLAPAGTQAS